MIKKKVSLGILLTMLFVTSFCPSVDAIGSEPTMEAKQVLEDVSSITAFNTDRVNLSDSRMCIRTKGENISWDKNREYFDVEVLSPNNSFEFGLDNGDIENLIVDDILVSTGDNYAQTTEFYEGGFTRTFLIESKQSAERYSCTFEVPDGFEFVYAIDEITGKTDGSVMLVDKEGNPVMAFWKAWATDAMGNDVDTRYVIEGNTVVQIVKHRNANYTYPIVADPSAQYNNWFSGTKWVKKKYGWCLSVNPSKTLKTKLYEKKGVNTAAVYQTSWSTLYNQHKTSAHWKKTNAMRDQYKCHVYCAGEKAKWNLDTWRPDVGYAKTVAALCNP